MKLSVIIPAYNCEKYIRRCLDSVISQKGADIEIIVVNDGSKDSTQEILDTYDGIKTVKTENGGVARARNTGLKHVTGDFVMFLDSDDFLKEGCVENVVKQQRETGADIVRFAYLEYYENKSTSVPVHTFTQRKLIKKDEFKKEIYPFYISGIMLNSICMTIFKRELVENLSFRTDMQTAEDAVFSLNAYTKAQSVLILPDAYYMYNRGTGSLTSGGLSVLKKYKCNFILSGEIAKKLSIWRLKSLKWYILTYLRPLRLTFDKIRRNRNARAVGKK